MGTLVSETSKHPKVFVTNDPVDCVRDSFSRSATKSIRQASNELLIPHSTFHDIVHKQLHLHAYKLQDLKTNDYRTRWEFSAEMINRIEVNSNF